MRWGRDREKRRREKSKGERGRYLREAGLSAPGGWLFIVVGDAFESLLERRIQAKSWGLNSCEKGCLQARSSVATEKAEMTRNESRYFAI